jgi:CheY-like chemotaxis protein
MPLQPITPSVGLRQSKQLAILYVEDDDTNWAVTELALEEKYSLVRAKTARKAFELLGAQSFDAILMDIELAGSELNGIEIVQIIKGNYPSAPPTWANVPARCTELPIVFMTAYNARYSRDELLAVGGSELIAKPVNFTKLALALTRLVARTI